MKVLFLGDVYGRSGRDALEAHLPTLINTHQPDGIIINGENSAHGIGINPKQCDELFEWGADCITSGNHIWNQREIIPYISKQPRLLRPANFPKGTTGNGVWSGGLKNGAKLTVVNLMGRVFMDPVDCPFQWIDYYLNQQHNLHRDGPVFVDFHAEVTSEKQAMGHFLDGRVAAVIGTHTHVPTADERILEHGTAFQTDTGMCGDYDSVIGARKDIPVQRFLRRIPGEKMQPATGKGTLCGVLVTLNSQTGLAKDIVRIKAG